MGSPQSGAAAGEDDVLRAAGRARLLIIERREGEGGERLIARFRQMVQRAGILREAKRRRRFISRSEARRIAQAKAARRARRNAEKADRWRNNGYRRA